MICMCPVLGIKSTSSYKSTVYGPDMAPICVCAPVPLGGPPVNVPYDLGPKRSYNDFDLITNAEYTISTIQLQYLWN